MFIKSTVDNTVSLVNNSDRRVVFLFISRMKMLNVFVPENILLQGSEIIS